VEFGLFVFTRLFTPSSFTFDRQVIAGYVYELMINVRHYTDIYIQCTTDFPHPLRTLSCICVPLWVFSSDFRTPNSFPSMLGRDRPLGIIVPPQRSLVCGGMFYYHMSGKILLPPREQSIDAMISGGQNIVNGSSSDFRTSRRCFCQ
jgi:hypothetical protein